MRARRYMPCLALCCSRCTMLGPVAYPVERDEPVTEDTIEEMEQLARTLAITARWLVLDDEDVCPVCRGLPDGPTVGGDEARPGGGVVLRFRRKLTTCE